MSIKLEYTTRRTGKWFRDYEKDVERIDLRQNDIDNIDLTPLKSCTNLRELFLSENYLQSIDLTPLSSCINFCNLHLDSNQLQSIDLIPLSSCANLQQLILSKNKLKSIDLTPLTSCAGILLLYIDENQLQRIDLSPLGSCDNLLRLYLNDNLLQYIDLTQLSSLKNIEDINLGNNPLQSLDLTPVCDLPKLSRVQIYSHYTHDGKTVDVTPLYQRYIGYWGGEYELSSWLDVSWKDTPVVYSPPTHLYPWSFIHGLSNMVYPFKNYRVQYDCRIALGLKDYGFIDYDFTEAFKSIPPETATEDAREILTKTLVTEIVAAVNSGGSTTGLNVEILSGKHSEIATLAPKIIELRAKEIERLTIPKRGNEFDLRELWVTAYGHQILSSIPKQPESLSISKIKPVKKALSKLGLELKIGDSPVSGVSMSKELKECIWWIVENKGEYWAYGVS
ncbi:MAG: leucine-rich repeat domain-containing protein [Candidatus Thorarchaeota archaeon]